MRITIHEPRSVQETVMFTGLRVLLSALLVIRAGLALAPYGGVAALFDGAAWSELFSGFVIGEARTDATLWALALGGSGVALALGCFTRSAAALAVAALAWMTVAGIEGWSTLDAFPWEGPTLLLGIGLYFLGMGPGDFSVDRVRRERARVRAIQDDETWLHPPYVNTEDPARDA